jgi:2-amino-4-hydroxy-6-hydroxymethyldihydropteridine diphosphokinase
MPIVYLGVGSNMGERLKNCLDAIDLLNRNSIFVKKKSSFYETRPWGVINQPNFINLVVEADTQLSPLNLLDLIKKIEKVVGRKETYRWGPRVIDLDILLFDDIIFEDERLKIPHPLMHLREFVLRPLCEIAPDVRHPIFNMRICELLRRIER